MKKVELQELFKGLQNQMVGQLNLNRQFINHPSSKGDALENSWINWLRTYLPNRYSIDSAIVIDHLGNTSDQIDIVIYDSWYTPFIFSMNKFKYIPAEGVYAIFEVKPDIRGHAAGHNYIEYAGRKVESVRVLQRTSAAMINSGKPVLPRPLSKIIGGILANTNTYSNDNDNKAIKKHLKLLKGHQTLDMACIADYGSFYVDYDRDEDILETINFQKRFNDYYQSRRIHDVIFSEPETAIVTFFLQLSKYLQQGIGTVPAIDFGAYSKSIGFQIDEKL